MIAQTVIDFCIKEIQEPFFARGRELEVVKPEDKIEMVKIFKKAGELGLTGVSISEKYGGLDLNFNTGLIFQKPSPQGFLSRLLWARRLQLVLCPLFFMEMKPKNKNTCLALHQEN